jgi:ketosteroid isomerase-like protein
MSLHDIFIRLATLDDDDTARVIAVALNADAEIRRIAGAGTGHWTALDVQRVARMLSEHAGVSKIAPRAAGHAAIAKAFEDELPFTQEERS